MSGDVTGQATEEGRREIGRVDSMGGDRRCICAPTHTDLEKYRHTHTDTKRGFGRKTQAQAHALSE